MQIKSVRAQLIAHTHESVACVCIGRRWVECCICKRFPSNHSIAVANSTEQRSPVCLSGPAAAKIESASVCETRYILSVSLCVCTTFSLSSQNICIDHTVCPQRFVVRTFSRPACSTSLDTVSSLMNVTKWPLTNEPICSVSDWFVRPLSLHSSYTCHMMCSTLMRPRPRLERVVVTLEPRNQSQSTCCQ